MEAEEDEEKKRRGDEKVKLHKDHKDDDDDPENDEFFSLARSQRSEAYKDEILNLREVNEKLKI